MDCRKHKAFLLGLVLTPCPCGRDKFAGCPFKVVRERMSADDKVKWVDAIPPEEAASLVQMHTRCFLTDA